MTDLEILSEFIAKAKRSTFAKSGEKAESSRVGSRDYLCQEGNLTYRDSYFGRVYDIGQEIVWEGDVPIWAMNYMGGMKEEYRHLSKDTFRFLRECLAQVDSSKPFRGPPSYKRDNFEYTNRADGDVTRFSGTERIFFEGEDIYERIYHGGLILI
ncbi:MAG: XRE family transcriptional regulator [Candidatus Nealsonbacteria bacterium CG03_land_8_20_14_0_80_36_12]|uniref:XRE family transcriptional regulator n=1 Tax=Candidatus Nealsonbacteria bacterium CG03_land_8_20_14_0_80_36_12 TaxID=1974701 RepID=A0A2M7BYW2_9BACT|nr:MAG: XRE family transcriptional regulator [Candidatus Nealsonbacteria bacterium CG03_land_8_20_14_0_80_36_12]